MKFISIISITVLIACFAMFGYNIWSALFTTEKAVEVRFNDYNEFWIEFISWNLSVPFVFLFFKKNIKDLIIVK